MLTGTVGFQGTAFATNTADSVRFVLRRSSDGSYWNGSEFQTNWTFVSLPVNSVGTWKTKLNLGPGGYHVVSYAVDSEGVVEAKPQVHFFSVLQ
jgi:hypothetical protein